MCTNFEKICFSIRLTFHYRIFRIDLPSVSSQGWWAVDDISRMLKTQNSVENHKR